MSKIIASAAIRGAHQFYREAEALFEKTRSEKGEDARIEFPGTAYYLPMTNALYGLEVKNVGGIARVLAEAKSLLPRVPAEHLWLPYLGDALDAGIASLLSEEVIVALRTVLGQEPQPDCVGFFTDNAMRQLGIQLVDGRMPGFAAILGAAPDTESAVRIIRDLQKRNILIFVGSSSKGVSIIDQLKEAKVEMGWDTYIVPYGRDTVTAIYPLHWAIRAALTFGGLKPGQGRECLLYCKDRVFAFGLTLGEVDDLKYATGAGAINMGFPIIADTDIPEILPSGICTYEHVVRELDPKKLVARAIEVRGLKVKFDQIDIPVNYAAAFEGERVRKEEMHVQFGFKYSKAVEYLKTADAEKVEDGKIEVVGQDIDAIEPGGAMDLAVVIEVAGRKMKPDFEGILERQIHRYLNHAMGVMHTGQREQLWVRISKDAVKAGFRLRHFGTILHAKFHDEYGGIVDKVQVTLFTRHEDVERIFAEAIPVFEARNARVARMTDESVDTFYSCTICQSYAPHHSCVITPERLGLCGAYNWLDGQAGYELKPSGPNQPIRKGRAIDERIGQWEGVNDFINTYSHRITERMSAYSIMVDPMTACGCFEVIIAILPEANGFIAVNRDYNGMTPVGMAFSTLAGSVGGGAQTPGFIGVGRMYLASRKFISAEGGLPRLVWMPKGLKEAMLPRLQERARELGMPDLIDKIADETVATDSEALLAFLERVKHPALTMDPLM